MSKLLFDQVSFECSRLTTRSYSTSFTLGVLCLDPMLRDPICSVYGFVRFADEIVDTFHEFDKRTLLEDFKAQTYIAIKNQISLNPILNSFQATVNRYKIEQELIDQFLRSMEMDLSKKEYESGDFQEYILGSAEVVGLMCLKIFCNGEEQPYRELKLYAMKLGAAFQKVNFLRDMKADYEGMGRTYFPGLVMNHFNDDLKRKIEDEISRDFREAYIGIKKLPRSARLGVYVAYAYYLALFKKIRNTRSGLILNTRIRIRNSYKLGILFLSILKHRLNWI